MVFLFQSYVHFISKGVNVRDSPKVQATAILRQVVVPDGEASSRLGVLSSFSPISLHNLFSASSHGFKS